VRFRTYAIGVLVAGGLAPLAVFGYLASRRAEEAAVAEVRLGTERIAQNVARRIASHVESERSQLSIIGAAIALGRDPELTLNAFAIQHPRLHGLTVYDASGKRIAGQGNGAVDEDHRMVAERAMAGESAAGKVRAAGESGPFAHTLTLGEPVWVAGERVGAVVAALDLVGIWQPINQVRLGRKGFVRLVASDGTLLAHGDPEERRYVFSGNDELDLVQRARVGDIILNQQGEEVFAAVSEVGGWGWLVLVEQPAAEALGGVRSMRRNLLFLAGGTLLFAIGAALLFGRRAVRGIERLESHTRVLASGDLEAVVEPKSGITELDSLGHGVNDMAGSLARLHQEAREQERLNTFGRVAAGLSHDLKQPLEHLRTAFEELAADPESEASWALFDWTRKSELPRIVRFLEDLRQLASEGKARLKVSEIEPEVLLEELAASLREAPLWSRIEFQVASSAPPFAGDEILLRRALYNLAKNASEAILETPGKAGTVRLEAAKNGGGVELYVRDDGPGIPPDRVERILHADFHSTKRTNGIGLGLGVARHVAQMHGGRIEVESEVGKGTTFTLRLPGEALA
jgi:signal transduction histidine kinase